MSTLADPAETNMPGKGVRRPSKRRRSHLKVVNQIPKRRRQEIEDSGQEETSTPEKWSRQSGQGKHKIERRSVKPGEVRTVPFNLIDSEIGESWPIPITVVHGIRPGPVVTLLGAIHGNELVGPQALTFLQSSQILGDQRAIDVNTMSGTLRIVPIVNLPGYRTRTRYTPDGRDLNRYFPGKSGGNTTQRIARRIWNKIIKSSDYIIDLHSAASGRTNLPHIRANLAHPKSSMLARSFGTEVLLDGLGPRGSLRRVSNEYEIGCVTFEGGGANSIDSDAVQIATYGILNVLRSLRMIPGYPSSPRFRLLASGSVWIRSDHGGLLDVLAPVGSLIESDEVVATVTDPEHARESVEIRAPSRGLLIGMATHPFVTAGTPIGHLLPLKKGLSTIKSRLDEDDVLMLSGILEDPIWREEETEDIDVQTVDVKSPDGWASVDDSMLEEEDD